MSQVPVVTAIRGRSPSWRLRGSRVRSGSEIGVVLAGGDRWNPDLTTPFADLNDEGDVRSGRHVLERELAVSVGDGGDDRFAGGQRAATIAGEPRRKAGTAAFGTYTSAL